MILCGKRWSKELALNPGEGEHPVGVGKPNGTYADRESRSLSLAMVTFALMFKTMEVSRIIAEIDPAQLTVKDRLTLLDLLQRADTLATSTVQASDWKQE
jgi:hypothetical protein